MAAFLYLADKRFLVHFRQNQKMWRDFHRLEDVLDSASTWLVTLDNNGCGSMLEAGCIICSR
jgi:uncharacterized Fe-S cluster-containing MiaB family protein